MTYIYLPSMGFEHSTRRYFMFENATLRDDKRVFVYKTRGLWICRHPITIESDSAEWARFPRLKPALVWAKIKTAGGT